MCTEYRVLQRNFCCNQYTTDNDTCTGLQLLEGIVLTERTRAKGFKILGIPFGHEVRGTERGGRAQKMAFDVCFGVFDIIVTVALKVTYRFVDTTYIAGTNHQFDTCTESERGEIHTERLPRHLYSTFSAEFGTGSTTSHWLQSSIWHITQDIQNKRDREREQRERPRDHIIITTS